MKRKQRMNQVQKTQAAPDTYETLVSIFVSEVIKLLRNLIVIVLAFLD